MRRNEFDQALHLLPEALRHRAVALRPHLSGGRCHRRPEIGDALELALMAARYEELTAAEHLISAAERLAGDHGHGPSPGWPAVQGEHHRARHHGLVAGWAGPTAGPWRCASCKDHATGIGYAASNDRFDPRRK